MASLTVEGRLKAMRPSSMERAAEAKGRAKGKAEEAAKASKQLAAERSERKLLEVKLAHLGGEMAALEARCAGHAREQVARLRQRHLEPICCPLVPPPLEPLQASVAAVRPSSAPTGHRRDGLQSARVGLQPLLHEAAPSFGPLTALEGDLGQGAAAAARGVARGGAYAAAGGGAGGGARARRERRRQGEGAAGARAARAARGGRGVALAG